MSHSNGQHANFVLPPKQNVRIPIVNPKTGKPLAVEDGELIKSQSSPALPGRHQAQQPVANAAKTVYNENITNNTSHQSTNSVGATYAQATPDSSAHAQAARNSSFHLSSSKESRQDSPFFPSRPGSSSGASMAPMAPHNASPPVSSPRLRYPPSDEELQRRKLDVYAKSFIPYKVRRVNELPGYRVCVTPPLKATNYDQYVCDSFGRHLLPPVLATDMNLDTPAISQDEPTKLDTVSYSDFFLHHLVVEAQRQHQDYESHWLYDHDATVNFVQVQPDEFVSEVTMLVPGLLENSPWVEEDDEVHLRQLRQSFNGRPAPEYWDFSSSSWVREWMQIVFHARVKTVIRATETMVLTVHGLNAETLEKQNPYSSGLSNDTFKFNVQFFPARGLISPQRRALQIAQESLRTAREITYDGGALLGTASEESLYWFQSMLFPTEVECNIQVNRDSGILAKNFFDLSLNLEQRIAVENICREQYGVLPYLISGPPGTGKTKTMIEIALQLVNNVPNVSHILMCAPSDQAADTLAERLRHKCRPRDMLRLNRPSRSFAEVPETLLPYCFVRNDQFLLPPIDTLMSCKIVVCSCRDASILLEARMTNMDLYSVQQALPSLINPTAPKEPSKQPVRLHWNALLVDEAAQATEPETLIPLCVVAPPLEARNVVFSPQIIMAGDEHQLNPRTSGASSPLRQSLFARLFSRPVYAEHPLARAFKQVALQRKEQTPGSSHVITPTLVSESMVPVLRPAFTNLIRNYRSHMAILAVPSNLWYHDTLEAEGPKSRVDRLSEWDGWQGRRWPVLFHNNNSSDDLELEGGGWFNPGEAEVALSYAKHLLASGLVTQREICIMSPFKAQVRRIRSLMRKNNMWGVNVGPTEAYQGLEHNVVILCTTRSRERFVAEDKERGWGLLGMPNATNVALTRAKCGLIIVGKRTLLCEDRWWKEVLDYCYRNGLMVDNTQLSSRFMFAAAPKRTRLEDILVRKDLGRGR